MLEAKKASLILVLGLSFLQADSKDLKSLDFSNIIASQIEMI